MGQKLTSHIPSPMIFSSNEPKINRQKTSKQKTDKMKKLQDGFGARRYR